MMTTLLPSSTSPSPSSLLSSRRRNPALRGRCRPHCHLEAIKVARERFQQEVSFKSKDKDVSLAKALLYVAAEDEAFVAHNRDIDARSRLKEMQDDPSMAHTCPQCDTLEAVPLAGKSISGWLEELDQITKEVEAELVNRDISCHLVEVLDAVNAVLFQSRGFKRFPVHFDPKYSYLHHVLHSGHGSAIMLSVIYIEVCRRLGVTIVGSQFGEDFLIWPLTENLEELFRSSSGQNIFSIVNGKCVEDPKSKASDVDSEYLRRLEVASNRDIIGIALANLIRLNWKRASRMNRGLMLTSPLRSIKNDRSGNVDDAMSPLLRPQELRLAIMASERILILQPHNWSLRRNHGMLLYYSREYAEAVQELSICMAFAPVEEAEILEPFVEKLHLLRRASSWESFEPRGFFAAPRSETVRDRTLAGFLVLETVDFIQERRYEF